MKRSFLNLSKLSLLVAALIMGFSSLALADSRGHGHHKHKHHKGKTVVIYGNNHHYDGGYHNHKKYRKHTRHHNRYIYKHRYIPYKVVRHYPVFDSHQQVQVNCVGNQPILGTVIGGVAGGLIGNQFGKGNGRIVTTVGGMILGSAIGNSLTVNDRHCATQVLEYATPGTQVSWRNPDNGHAYTVLPTNNFQRNDGRYCREYHSIANIGSQQQETYGTACRQPDGAWEIVSTN